MVMSRHSYSHGHVSMTVASLNHRHTVNVGHASRHTRGVGPLANLVRKDRWQSVIVVHFLPAAKRLPRPWYSVRFLLCETVERILGQLDRHAGQVQAGHSKRCQGGVSPHPSPRPPLTPLPPPPPPSPHVDVTTSFPQYFEP